MFFVLTQRTKGQVSIPILGIILRELPLFASRSSLRFTDLVRSRLVRPVSPISAIRRGQPRVIRVLQLPPFSQSLITQALQKRRSKDKVI